jgi:general secretion pathway protein G
VSWSRSCPDMRQSSGGRRGFTLIEMMVVVAIIGTLAMLVGPSVFRHVGDASVAAARTQIEILSAALESYRLDTGEYPATSQGLQALRVRPEGPNAPIGWRGPYLRRSVPLDPWNRPYIYESPGTRNPESYDLYTLGRDNLPGGSGQDGDLTSWGEDPTR